LAVGDSAVSRQTIRVIAADAQPLFRRGLRLMLDATEDIQLVAEAGDPATLAQAVADQPADVLLIDQDLAGRRGLDVLMQVRDRQASLQCVLMGDSLEADTVVSAMRRGVRGVLLKTMPAEVIEACLRKVASGERWIEMKSFGQAIDSVLAEQSGRQAAAETLSPREREIVRLVGEGLRNREIAQRCGIREATVKSHLSHIFEKTGVDSRLELARLDLGQGAPGDC